MSVEICCENRQNLHLKTDSNDDYATQLDESINKIIEKEKFVKYNVEKRMISTDGGNYLGVLYEIDIKGKTKDGNKELNLFIKKVIPGEGNMTVINVKEVYMREIFIYTELSKVFDKLQEDYNVPPEEIFKIAKGYDGSSTNAIILENLAKKGYTTNFRMDVVSLKYAEIAIQNLARFHGLSFVLKEKQPEYYNRKINSITYPFTYQKQWLDMLESSKNMCRRNLDEHLKDKAEKIFETMQKKFERYFIEDVSKMCLCHGDYRPNNILAYYKDGEATDLITVDYQLIHPGCPIADLIYFIFTGTDRAFRKAHLTHLKYLYHETLSKFLAYFDIDVDEVLPKNMFEELYDKWLEYGLLVAIAYSPLIFVSEDDVPDITADINKEGFKLHDSKYKERIQGVIEDFIEWGYL